MKVDYKTTVGAIVNSTGGQLKSGNVDSIINSVTTDSRTSSNDSLFIPIVGKKFDGHNFVEDLVLKRNVKAFLTVREDLVSLAKGAGISAILCDDTLVAYGKLAESHRNAMEVSIIGITGTNGKTTTKELIWSVLNKKYKSLKNEKNYNNEIGVPYTLLGLKEDHELAVIEMGMNNIGEIDILSRMAKPDMAVITNVGEGHLEHLGTIENVAYAKSEIMNGMKEGAIIYLNRDSQRFHILNEKALKKKLVVKTFGLSEDAEIKPDNYEVNKDSIRFLYKDVNYELPVYGIHNIYNALAAMAIALDMSIDSEIIKTAFNEFNNVNMRGQVIERGYIVINDTYNSNPLSAKYALISLSEIFPDRRKIAVLSDMKELGKASQNYHFDLGKKAYEFGCNLLCVWGEMAEDIAKGAWKSGMKKENALYFKSKDELINYTLSNIDENDVILVKGSRSMKMEEVVEAIIH